MLYCDHNATTPLRAEVLEAMLPFLGDELGNASSVHRLGSRARCAVEEARAKVAALLGAQTAEIVFTSGGTESNNLALLGPTGIGRIIVSSIEHASVRAPAARLRELGHETHDLPVDSDGIVRLDALAALGPRNDSLVSVAWANNEVGSVQPIGELIQACRRSGAHLHVDAVQAAGKIPIAVEGIELLSVSAHKLGGPKGVGALFVRKGFPIEARTFGGGQERGRRAGTENVAGIVGFGVACELAQRELATASEGWVALRETLWDGLRAKIEGLRRNGSAVAGLPNTLSVSCPGVRGEALVAALDLEDIAVSSGSACAAGAGEPSHVLMAMGRSADEARDAVRFSFGRGNRREDVPRIVDATVAAVRRMRATRKIGGTHA